jgi:hypothetical protein
MRRVYGALRPAHEAAIRIAARSPRRPDTIKDHSPGLVSFVFQELNWPVVQPSYAVPHLPDAFHVPEEILRASEFDEGSAVKVLLNRYERDPRARDACIKYYGAACVACGKSLADQYGPQVIDLIDII